MDYNDVQNRLKKIYTSVDEQFSYGHTALETTHIENIHKGNGGNMVSITFFNPNDEVKLLNQINNVVANLANLKDCLKTKFEQRGDDPQIIEDEINNSLLMKVILDLSNQEKHGYPLTNRRSEKDPLIKNINRVLSPSNKPDNVRYEKSDGSAIMNMMSKVTADITDSQGNLLFKLDELIEEGVNFWEDLIKKYNIS